MCKIMSGTPGTNNLYNQGHFWQMATSTCFVISVDGHWADERPGWGVLSGQDLLPAGGLKTAGRYSGWGPPERLNRWTVAQQLNKKCLMQSMALNLFFRLPKS